MLKIFTTLFTITSFSLITFAQAPKIIWEKTVGGDYSEYLTGAIATPDYGFLVIGSSSSSATGDKVGLNQGGLDYFLWKMDEHGQLEWQQSFGGDQDDYLMSASITQEGGFILGGTSASMQSGDKTEVNFGLHDFWILKINPKGDIEWQKSLGGLGDDTLKHIIQTNDGGYLVAGNSSSPQSAIKSQDSVGSHDYWVVKLNKKGAILWEKTFGGIYEEELIKVIETRSGYLLVGTSNSPTSDIKKVSSTKMDVWLVSIDHQGELITERTLSQDSDQVVIGVQKNKEDQLVVSSYYSDLKGRKVVFETLELDLTTSSSKTLDVSSSDYITSALVQDHEILLTSSQLGYTKEFRPNSRYAVYNFNEEGKEQWHKTIGEEGFNYLETTLKTRDGSLILFGNSDKKIDKSSNTSNFYMVKLGLNSQEENRELIEIYPNPTKDYVNVLINQSFEKASIAVYDLHGRKLQSTDVKYHSTGINLISYPSGVYILKINYNNQSQSIKIIKK